MLPPLLLLLAAALADDPAQAPPTEAPPDKPTPPGPPPPAPEAPLPPPATGEILVVEARLDAGDDPREITAEDVAVDAASSLAESLEAHVGVSASTGSKGERLLVVRGFEQDQVAVFIDGIPTTVPYNGSLDLGKYPSSLLSTARVVPGASAALFGPAGLGGAVDIRSAPPPATPEARASLRGSAVGALEATGSAGGPLGPVRLGLAGGGIATPGQPLSASFTPTDREDGGLRDASDRRSTDLRGQAATDLGTGGDLLATVHYLTGDYGIPTALVGTPRYWRFTSFQDLGASLGHAALAGERVSLRETLFYTWNRNVLDNYDDATRLTQDSDAAYHSTYRDQQVGGSAGLDVALGAPATPAGVVRARLYANHQVHHSIPDIGEPMVDVSTTLLSGVLAGEGHMRRFGAFGGVELDAEVPGADTAFAPAPAFAGPVAGVRYTVPDRAVLAASVARRARFPTLKERFSSARGARIPNLDLGPETAWHAGLDAAVRLAALEASASVYDAEVDDLIEAVVLDTGEEQLQNTGEARLLGAEGGIRFAPSERLDLEAGGGWLHASRPDRLPPEDQLEYRPAWQARLAGGVRPVEPVLLQVSWNLVGPQAFYQEETLEWGTLGAWDLLHARAAWQVVPDGLLVLQVRNALDRDVQSRYGYPDPGREIWLGLEVGGARSP